jgi:hypothetical protein
MRSLQDGNAPAGDHVETASSTRGRLGPAELRERYNAAVAEKRTAESALTAARRTPASAGRDWQSLRTHAATYPGN